MATEPTPFSYNYFDGSRRWRDSIGRARDTYPLGSATQYGVDVVVIGDSTATFGTLYECWPYLLRNLLQERFNRPGVQGGFGYLPFNVNSANYGGSYNEFNHVNGSGTWDKTHNDNGRPSCGLYEAKINPPSANNKIWRYFDPTATAGVENRQGITGWQYVGLSYSGLANSVYCDSNASNGALTPSNVVAGPDGGGQEAWSAHWAHQSGLNPATAYTLQIASKSSTDQTWANGLILYNGDFFEGVRLHNLSAVGSNSDNWLNGSNAQSLQANIDNWTTGANGGACNAKLFLINTILNDRGMGSSQVISAATYKSNLQALIDHIVARPSRPCVGLIINQPWSSAVAHANAITAFPDYRDAVLELADENPDVVFVVDLWKDLTDSTHAEYAPHGAGSAGGSMYDRGWYLDGVHRSPDGQFAEARQIFAILSAGV